MAPILHQSPLETTDGISVRSFCIHHPLLQSHSPELVSTTSSPAYGRITSSTGTSQDWIQGIPSIQQRRCPPCVTPSRYHSRIHPHWMATYSATASRKSVGIGRTHSWSHRTVLQGWHYEFQMVSFWVNTRTDHLSHHRSGRPICKRRLSHHHLLIQALPVHHRTERRSHPRRRRQELRQHICN